MFLYLRYIIDQFTLLSKLTTKNRINAIAILYVCKMKTTHYGVVPPNKLWLLNL